MVLLRHRIFDPEVQSYLQRDPYPSTNSRDRELSTWSVIRYTDRPDDAPYLEAKGSQRLPLLSSGSVEHRIRERIIQASLDQTVDSEQAFYVADLSVVYKQYMKWRDHLPHIQPFFAIKSNPDLYILRLLARLGTGFDCASYGEISQILELGIDPSRIIFANPCKAESFIRYSALYGVNLMTFDNFDELDKISRAHPSAQLVLRILVENKGSIYKLGQKFGAPMDTISKLLARAQDLHLNVVGVSFHAGSGVADVDLYLGTFANAIERARKAFDLGKVAGYDFQLLDIGGGFQDKIFEQMATVCNLALNQHFPEWKRGGITVIAEPGQFFATNAFTLVTNIIARRDQSSKTHSMLYVNDGLYGSFDCVRMSEVFPTFATIRGSFVDREDIEREPHESVIIWGPTCDSTDMICREALVPTRLTIGDWLVFSDMGAYSSALSTRFNGFRPPEVIYTTGPTGTPEAIEVRRILTS